MLEREMGAGESLDRMHGEVAGKSHEHPRKQRFDLFGGRGDVGAHSDVFAARTESTGDGFIA